MIGIYYFDSSTVTGTSYLNMLNNYFLPIFPILHNNIVFQQDGAPPHYDRRVDRLLNENFSSACIGKWSDELAGKVSRSRTNGLLLMGICQGHGLQSTLRKFDRTKSSNYNCRKIC